MKNKGPSASVLLIGQEPEMLRALFLVLCEDGYRAMPFSTPEGIEAQIPEGVFDLAVADLHERDEASWDVLRRAHNAYPDLPVIVLVPYGDERSLARARAYGWVKEVLMKPVAYQDLMQALQRI